MATLEGSKSLRLTDTVISPGLTDTVCASPVRPSADSMAVLRRAFGAPFTVLGRAAGTVLVTAEDRPSWDWSAYAEVIDAVARRGRAELIADEDPLLVLAFPWTEPAGESCAAVIPFVGRQVAAEESLSLAAARLGMRVEEVTDWAKRQSPWPAGALLSMGEMVLEHLAARHRVAEVRREADSLSRQIGVTYEEISLLHRLTENLKISKSDEDLARLALDWLLEVLPAKGLAIQLMAASSRGESLGREGRREPALLTKGHCPVGNQEFTRLIGHLVAIRPADQPMVVNGDVTGRPEWPFPQVRQAVAVPLAEADHLFGWMAAFDHVTDGEFGTDEASLLSSVAAILGIHGGNIALYEEQAELMAGIIRALTAAIDAKDEYTRGHSNRVARIAVRLAQELGFDHAAVNAIYLAGLLHDIGKIGIADSVLRKPETLSAEEYQHIKTHTEIGHRILRDLKRLDHILPVILHHHEAWNGAGYPHQLHSDQIPMAARIVAVADAYDAMSSDRPYRKGLLAEKIDMIFREGAGKQWDPDVVAAFFRARDDIRQIVSAENTELAIELQPWK